MLAAGCAVGLGNVWRFPFIVGEYGGAAFVLLYFLFLVLLGFPVMVMELSIGRAGQRDLIGAVARIKPGRPGWKGGAALFFSGNLLMVMFYTVVTGWLIAYGCFFATGKLPAAGQEEVFHNLLADPAAMIGWTATTTLIALIISLAGIRNGVERSVKWMMLALFLLLAILCMRSFWLEGAQEGLDFYLAPDFSRMLERGFGHAVLAALGQAFFTLGLGIGSMALVGSYTERKRSLTQEAATVIVLDTLVAFLAGLVIFPACATYHVQPDSGPGLIFLTLPEVFTHMSGGRWWGTLFFLFMGMAALTTVVVFFETLVTYLIDERRMKRQHAVALIAGVVLVVTLPCILGFNLWKEFQPLGAGTNVLDLEDFLVSDNLLPLGGLFMVLFCTRGFGWGWKNFLAEADAGKGWRFPVWLEFYCRWVLPAIILAVFVFGYRDKFITWLS